MSISAEIAAARRSAPLSQADLADAAGLSRMTVQRVEAGDIDPKLSTVLEMARVLGLDLMLVPASLKVELQNFIRSGGKVLGQPAGIAAPLSIVDQIANNTSPRR